jgi:hypothetical protein
VNYSVINHATHSTRPWGKGKSEVDSGYIDQAFLDLLEIKLPKVSLSDFWPSRGSVWDGLGRSETGKVFFASKNVLQIRNIFL